MVSMAHKDPVCIDLTESNCSLCHRVLNGHEPQWRYSVCGELYCDQCSKQSSMIRQFHWRACSVCEAEHKLLFTPCGHVICDPCYRLWHEKFKWKKCAFCRKDFVNIEKEVRPATVLEIPIEVIC